MTLFENFKTGGHDFSGDENLEKFRFTLLNLNLGVASFFSGLSYYFSVSGFTPFDPTYQTILLCCTVAFVLCIYPLRINKRFYLVIASLTILNSLVLFYAALVTSFLKDEFRLIWFFLVVFAGFVYLGKRIGLNLTVFVLVSIGVINHYHDLGFSQAAEITFTLSFIMFAAFAYNFLDKIENDSIEFKVLNRKLEGKVEKEVQLRQQQEQMLLQQYRMANMGGMLDAIAHQWRQPLMSINAILMNMDHALEDIQNKNKPYLDGKIDDLASLTQHMSQTIEDFRSLLKVNKEQTVFSIQGAVNEVLVLMKSSLTDVSIEFDTEHDNQILGHKSELIQIVIILISNAIEVLESRRIEDKRIIISISSTSHQTCISIQDNAGGIDVNNLNVIFNPYFTTKQQSGGTGLGLYITKIIVEQRMQGSISACNVGDGAKFTLSLSHGLNL